MKPIQTLSDKDIKILEAAFASEFSRVFEHSKKNNSKCECGAYKTSQVERGMLGHSPWCPWSSK